MRRRLFGILSIVSLASCAIVMMLQFHHIPQYIPQIYAEYHKDKADMLGVADEDFHSALDAAGERCKPDATLTAHKVAAMPLYAHGKDYVIGDVTTVRIVSMRNGTRSPVSKWWTVPLVLTAIAADAARRRIPLVPTGRCVCGYDLRATPNHCPECGRFPKR